MHSFSDFIKSSRLEISPLKNGDAESLVAITNQESVIQSISFLSSPFTLQDAEKLIQSAKEDHQRLYAVKLKNGEMVGFFGAHLHDIDALEIGYWFGESYRGNGYASETLGAMLLALQSDFPNRTIFAECRLENAASTEVLRKNSFAASHEKGLRPGRTKFHFISEKNGAA